MAKTIKEKSIDYRKEQWKNVSPSGYDWCDSHIEQAYIAGANAVIEELQSLIKNTGGEGGNYHYNLYIGLKRLVKELKG